VFPFSYTTSTDANSGKTDGRNLRCTATNSYPKIMNVASLPTRSGGAAKHSSRHPCNGPDLHQSAQLISLIALTTTMKSTMAQLIVRGIDDAIVKALRERAARNGRSAEAEHRAILEAELRGPKRRTFAEALMAMPNVGRDEDFARIDEPVKRRRVPR